jgi:hypothetical protein
MANKQITGLSGLTTTKTLCGFDYMVVERLTGANPAVTSNTQLSSIYNYVISQPITAIVGDASITEVKLSDNIVSTSKLKDRSVTTIKIAQNAVTGYELASNSVSGNHIADSTVTSQKLNSNVVKSNGGLSIDTNGLYLNTPIKSYVVNTTLSLVDANSIIEANNASSMSITVPANASVAFPIGTNIVVYQKGAGQVTINGATGVTILTNSSKVKTSAQNAVAALFKVAVDTWLLGGDLV